MDAFFQGKDVQKVTQQLGFVSPIAVCFHLPLTIDRGSEVAPIVGDWRLLAYFTAFYVALNCLLLAAMSWLFRTRWRVVY
jgi:hypothetical protein